MHSYLKAVGFSQVTRRSEVKEIIRDVIANYDEKVCVENHPEGVFVQFSKNYGCDCGISVCGQYDENGEFHVEYYFPFFRGTGITSKEKVTVERHTDKESYAGAYADREDGTGKWVRYDENGRMIKGWSEKDNNTYYFDEQTGAMVKGWANIDGTDYYFDTVTGIRA